MLDAREERRLQVLHSTHLLDSLPERAFDRLSRLAAGLLKAPIALVSLIDERRQFIKSAIGLNEPWATTREVPLSHSICQHVTRDRAALVLEDARKHPILRLNGAVSEMAVVAYAGVPLIVSDEAIGAFCVVDTKVHRWSRDEIALLNDLAESVVAEIDLRIALRDARQQRALTEALLESMGDAVLAVDSTGKYIVVNHAARHLFDGVDVGGVVSPTWSQEHRSVREDGSEMPASEGALTRAMRGEITTAIEFTLQRASDSSAKWIEATGRPVLDEDGNLVAAVALYRDMTEKKRQTALYRSLVSHIPNALVALYDHDLRCIALDGQLREKGVLAEPNPTGKTLRDVAGVPPDDPGFDQAESVLRRALDGESGEIDVKIGDTILALSTSSFRDVLGKVASGIVLARDVTQERQLEAALRQSEEIHRATVQHLPNGAIILVDSNLRYVAAGGPALPAMTARAGMDDLVGKWVHDIPDETRRKNALELIRQVLSGQKIHVELVRGDRVYDVHAVPLEEKGTITHALLVAYDITDRKREIEEVSRTRDLLSRERALLQTTLTHIEDAVVLLDEERKILLGNKAFSMMFGLTPEQYVGMPREVFFEHLASRVEQPAALLAELEAAEQSPPTDERHCHEVVLTKPTRRVLRRSWACVELPEGQGHLITWHDATAEKEVEAERERLLLVDTLTGIANRRAAEAALEVESSRASRTGQKLCVALFDIDHFKGVNDTFGHGVGDDVLKIVASTLVAQARLTDTVARWGGEEFLAVLPGSLDGALAYCERARAAIEKLTPAQVGRITISVGVAELRSPEPLQTLVERADAGLYQAKAKGRNRVEHAT